MIVAQGAGGLGITTKPAPPEPKPAPVNPPTTNPAPVSPVATTSTPTVSEPVTGTGHGAVLTGGYALVTVAPPYIPPETTETPEPLPTQPTEEPQPDNVGADQDAAYDGYEFIAFGSDTGGRQLASAEAEGKILRGMAFVDSMVKYCADFGIDARAAAANAMNEGISGLIGDTGTAYGPWQIHATDGRLAAFAGKPRYSPEVQKWAWTDNAVEYAIRSMVKGGAKYATGHTAVRLIVTGFERPANEAGAIITRDNTYDYLVGKGSGWKEYVAGYAQGPQLQGTAPTLPATGTPVNAPPPSNPGTVTLQNKQISGAWNDLIHFLARTIPSTSQQATALASDFGRKVK